MKFNWQKPFGNPKQYLLAHLIWGVASINFSIGLFARQIEATPWVEAFTLACIVLAQFFSLRNYRCRRIFTLFLVIVGLCFWSVAFMLRSLDLISTSLYGILVGIFVGFVAFNNYKQDPNWYLSIWRK